ncbi:MAG TPA: thermonuclease family protein [Hyphomonas sp.]|nr:thermonuclease family protein [Hyphomonas sp.]HRX74392.1 thermonuclease family protein [Hyphomonas sp.]
MAKNVIKFDPKDRRRKRPPPTLPKAPRRRSSSNSVLQLASTVLIVLAIGFGATWVVEDTNQDSTPNHQIGGTASVIDGDTIEIHGERIRIDGYDTPESGSMCGTINVYQKASNALADFVWHKNVVCDTNGKDRYGRRIADCKAGGKSVAEYMVEQGWARDWPKYSNRAYADEERKARAAKRGLWGLNCPSNLWGNRKYN